MELFKSRILTAMKDIRFERKVLESNVLAEDLSSDDDDKKRKKKKRGTRKSVIRKTIRK